MNLNDIRKEIDSLDNRLLKIIRKRLDLAVEAGIEKEKLDLPIVDLNRQKQIISKVSQKAKKIGLSSRFTTKIFNEILKESIRLQGINK